MPEPSQDMPEALQDKPLKPAASFPNTAWPLLLVLLAVGIGVAYALFGRWLRASLMVGGAMGLAGVFRLFLPRRIAGLLVVRRRQFDVVVYFGLSALILIVALIVPASS